MRKDIVEAQNITLSTLDKEKPSILLAAGGTAGHVNPAIAIAKALQKLNPELQIVFCGSGELIEKRLVERTGFPFYWIEAKGLTSKAPHKLWQTFRTTMRGVRQAEKLLGSLNVKACIGAGGYVCVPLILAARKQKTKYFLHEQNAFPGRSISMLSKGADAVYLSFEETKSFFPKAKRLVLSGNPIDKSFFNVDKEQSRQEKNIDPGTFYVLVTGGSLGAETLNKVSLELVEALLNKGIDNHFVHLISGKNNYSNIVEEYEEGPHLKISDYVYDMPNEMAAADLVICRAGAGTCAELQALGKASILVPYPYAIADHQTKNAKVLTDNNAAFLINDAEISLEKLETIVLELLENPDKLLNMGLKAKELAKEDADLLIAKDILEDIKI